MLTSSILHYKKSKKDIEEIGFKVNLYNVCIANSMVDDKQHTCTWHVDDVKSGHVNAKVNNKFYECCKSQYGSKENGYVKAA